MRTIVATSPGHPGRANEDLVVTVDNAVIVLDGAGIPDTEAICRHGVLWYAASLGAALAATLRADPLGDLRTVLRASLAMVAESHSETCDLAHPCSPQATVAIARARGDRLDYLVLGDTFVVLDAVGQGPRVITDPREAEVRARCEAMLVDCEPGMPGYDEAVARAIAVMRSLRNARGGYWIAKEDPAAADHAVTGSVPVNRVRGVAVLTNGAAPAAPGDGPRGWAGLFEVLRETGPETVLEQLREAEATQRDDAGRSDDATLVFCEVAPGHLAARSPG